MAGVLLERSVEAMVTRTLGSAPAFNAAVWWTWKAGLSSYGGFVVLRWTFCGRGGGGGSGRGVVRREGMEGCGGEGRVEKSDGEEGMGGF